LKSTAKKGHIHKSIIFTQKFIAFGRNFCYNINGVICSSKPAEAIISKKKGVHYLEKDSNLYGRTLQGVPELLP
jgi:hypothetical protein